MKWLLALCVLVALVCSALGQDFTSRYAELASPVPGNVNVGRLVDNLRSAQEE